MISHEFASIEFRLSTLVLFPKNKRKSINVSLSNLILLKYHAVLVPLICNLGFKKSHSTRHCTFVINEIIQYYQNNDTNIYVTLLDASRTFDRVNYVKLFSLLSINVTFDDCILHKPENTYSMGFIYVTDMVCP